MWSSLQWISMYLCFWANEEACCLAIVMLNIVARLFKNSDL